MSSMGLMIAPHRWPQPGSLMAKGVGGGGGGLTWVDGGNTAITTTAGAGFKTDTIPFSKTLLSVDQYLLMVRNFQTYGLAGLSARTSSVNELTWHCYDASGGTSFNLPWALYKVPKGVVQQGWKAVTISGGGGNYNVDITVLPIQEYSKAWAMHMGAPSKFEEGFALETLRVLDPSMTSSTNFRMPIQVTGNGTWHLSWLVWGPTE